MISEENKTMTQDTTNPPSLVDECKTEVMLGQKAPGEVSLDYQEAMFRCSCYDLDHEVILGFDPEGRYLVVGARLPHFYGFFKRCWVALKYILGVDKIYSHYEEVLLREEDARKVVQFIDSSFNKKEFDNG